MSVVIENAGGNRKRTSGLWRSRGAGVYFAVLGGLHLMALGLVFSRHSELVASLAPWWFFAAVSMYPVSRFAAGIALLLKSRIAVSILGFFAVCAGIALFGGSSIWQSQTGMPLVLPQIYVVFARVDFLVILATFIASFGWQARGLLK